MPGPRNTWLIRYGASVSITRSSFRDWAAGPPGYGAVASGATRAAVAPAARPVRLQVLRHRPSRAGRLVPAHRPSSTARRPVRCPRATSRRNGLDVSHESFNTDVERLLKTLERVMPRVRGHEKVPTGGQVGVSTGGQIKVSTPCWSCRSGTAGPGGDGEGANHTPPPPGSSIEICEGPHGHHFCLSTSWVVPGRRAPLRHHS